MNVKFIFKNASNEKIVYTCKFNDVTNAYVTSIITDFSNTSVSQTKNFDSNDFKFITLMTKYNSQNSKDNIILLNKFKTKDDLLLDSFSEELADSYFNTLNEEYIFMQTNVLRVIKALVSAGMSELTIAKGNEVYKYNNIVPIETQRFCDVRFFADFEVYNNNAKIFESSNSSFALPYFSTPLAGMRNKLVLNSAFTPYPLVIDGEYSDGITSTNSKIVFLLDTYRQYFLDEYRLKYIELLSGTIKKDNLSLSGLFFFKDNTVIPYMCIAEEYNSIENTSERYIIYNNINETIAQNHNFTCKLLPNSENVAEITEDIYKLFDGDCKSCANKQFNIKLPDNWFETLNYVFYSSNDFEEQFTNLIIKKIMLSKNIKYGKYIFNLSDDNILVDKRVDANMGLYEADFMDTIKTNSGNLKAVLQLYLLFCFNKYDYESFYSVDIVKFYPERYKFEEIKCNINNSVISMNLDNNISNVKIFYENNDPISYIKYAKRRKEIDNILTSEYNSNNFLNYINNSKRQIVEFMLEIKGLFDISNHYRNDYVMENITKPKKYTLQSILKSQKFLYSQATKQLIEEEYLKYKSTDKIPYLAFMGAPGIGKTTMAKNLAKIFTQESDSLLICSASDLKGAYVGHTAYQVFNLLKNAMEKDKIIFIDEAYHLTNDVYGKEALDILLPIISGDRKEIEVVDKNKENFTSTLKLTFEDGKVPVIWLAGYEPEMRELFANNKGLYRRVVKISLDSPSISDLCNTFSIMARENELNYLTSPQILKNIKEYFAWASGKEYINYFGNYAGVISLFESCKIMLSSLDIEKGVILDKLHQIILNKKSEIKKQYNACLKEKTDKFKVQSEIDTRFKDIGGCEAAKNSLKEIVSILSENTKLTDKGIFAPKGALLIGPPGTGKTLLSRALAGEVQEIFNQNIDTARKVAFIAVSSTELTSAKDVKILFKEAEEFDSCIIFIDELDAIGRNRKYVDSTREILIQLMKEMDGFEVKNNIFILAATNDPDVLDPALKRPGRFDRIIEVDLPEKKERTEIIKMYLDKLSSDVASSIVCNENMLEKIAAATTGYSPSNIKNLINEAAMKNIACTNALNEISKCYFEARISDAHMSEDEKELFECVTGYTLDKKFEEYSNQLYHRIKAFAKDISSKEEILLKLLKIAPEDNLFVDIMETIDTISLGVVNFVDKEKEFQTTENEGMSATAIHEVGHALTSYLLKLPPFEKLSIISRGNSLGYVQYSNNYKFNTKSKFITRIKVLLGGRIAEELFYGENISSGAVSDIHKATLIANDLITKFGMHSDIGPISLKNSISSYISYQEDYTCSDLYRNKVDEAIESILKEEYQSTKALLLQHKELIEKLAKIAFEKETLTGDEFILEVEKLIQ